MAQKLIKIERINSSLKEINGVKRHSLIGGGSSCTFTEREGKVLPKEGDTIVAEERDITLADGTAARGWYYVSTFATAMASDLDLQKELFKANALAAVQVNTAKAIADHQLAAMKEKAAAFALPNGSF